MSKIIKIYGINYGKIVFSYWEYNNKNILIKEKIDEIILVGSSSITLKIQEENLKIILIIKFQFYTNINLDEIIAQGAAFCGNHNSVLIMKMKYKII